MSVHIVSPGSGPQPSAADRSAGPPRATRWLVAGAVVLAAGLLALFALGRSAPPPPAITGGGGQVVTRQQLLDEYGIRLNLVGVTAAGGLVDLRFTITDVAKAKKLFTDPSVMPAVVAERTGTVLQAPHGGHHGHITPIGGASYFVLIGNAGGVVQRGVPVSVLINGVRVEHIAAET